jgi:uroporphyrinogen decarboxylase
MLSRREMLFGVSAAAFLRGAQMTSTERVDRALKGEDVDRTPFSFWHHFLDEEKPPESHAKSTLDFHRQFHTDLVKVMSDYPYPKPKGQWYEARVTDNPFPRQIKALELIRDGLSGEARFVETLFNPWYVATKLASPEQVVALKNEKPQRLMDMLEAIAKSEASHARRAIQAGAAGIFVSIANAQDGVLSEADYAKFSEPFDKMVFEAVSSAPLNVLHLHTDAKYGDKLYHRRFLEGWPAAAINYSIFTYIAIPDIQKTFRGAVMTGLDERNYRGLTPLDLKREWLAAKQAANKKFILTPGCSVPNDSTDEELSRLTNLLGA